MKLRAVRASAAAAVTTTAAARETTVLHIPHRRASEQTLAQRGPKLPVGEPVPLQLGPLAVSPPNRLGHLRETDGCRIPWGRDVTGTYRTRVFELLHGWCEGGCPPSWGWPVPCPAERPNWSLGDGC